MSTPELHSRGRQGVRKKSSFAFNKGELVLVKWADGMVYFAKIKHIYYKREKCVVVFDDKSQDEADFSQIHSVDETTTDIICIKCKKDNSDSPNEIVLCDGCGIGFHQRCHNPPIPTTALQLDIPWKCCYCLKDTKCPFLTESLDVLQNLLSDDNESSIGEDEVNGMESECDVTQDDSDSKSAVLRRKKGSHTEVAIVNERRKSLRNSTTLQHQVVSSLAVVESRASLCATNGPRKTPRGLSINKEWSISEDEEDADSSVERILPNKKRKRFTSTQQKRLKSSSVDTRTEFVSRLESPDELGLPILTEKANSDRSLSRSPQGSSKLHKKRSLRVSLSIGDDPDKGRVTSTPLAINGYLKMDTESLSSKSSIEDNNSLVKQAEDLLTPFVASPLPELESKVVATTTTTTTTASHAPIPMDVGVSDIPTISPTTPVVNTNPIVIRCSKSPSSDDFTTSIVSPDAISVGYTDSSETSSIASLRSSVIAVAPKVFPADETSAAGGAAISKSRDCEQEVSVFRKEAVEVDKRDVAESAVILAPTSLPVVIDRMMCFTAKSEPSSSKTSGTHEVTSDNSAASAAHSPKTTSTDLPGVIAKPTESEAKKLGSDDDDTAAEAEGDDALKQQNANTNAEMDAEEEMSQDPVLIMDESAQSSEASESAASIAISTDALLCNHETTDSSDQPEKPKLISKSDSKPPTAHEGLPGAFSDGDHQKSQEDSGKKTQNPSGGDQSAGSDMKKGSCATEGDGSSASKNTAKEVEMDESAEPDVIITGVELSRDRKQSLSNHGPMWLVEQPSNTFSRIPPPPGDPSSSRVQPLYYQVQTAGPDKRGHATSPAHTCLALYPSASHHHSVVVPSQIPKGHTGPPPPYYAHVCQEGASSPKLDAVYPSSVATTKPFAIVTALPPLSEAAISQKPGEDSRILHVIGGGGGVTHVIPSNISQDSQFMAVSVPDGATGEKKRVGGRKIRAEELQSIQKKIGDAFSTSSESMLVSAFEEAWERFQANGRNYKIALAKDIPGSLAGEPVQGMHQVQLVSTTPRMVAPKLSSMPVVVAGTPHGPTSPGLIPGSPQQFVPAAVMPGGSSTSQKIPHQKQQQQQYILQPITSNYTTLYAIPVSSGAGQKQTYVTTASASLPTPSQSEHASGILRVGAGSKTPIAPASYRQAVPNKVSSTPQVLLPNTPPLPPPPPPPAYKPRRSQVSSTSTATKPASLLPTEPKKPSKKVCNRCRKSATFLCSGCQHVWYCGKDCQLRDWDHHADHCKA